MRSAGTAGCATSSSPPPACAWHTWRGRQRKSIREHMMQCSVGEGGLTGRSRARAGLCGPACLASCSHVQPLGLSMTTDTPCADNGIGLLVCTETLPHLQLRLYQLQACSTCRGSCSRASKPVDSEAESPALLHSDASAASAPGARKMRTKSPFGPPPKAKRRVCSVACAASEHLRSFSLIKALAAARRLPLPPDARVCWRRNSAASTHKWGHS